MSHYSNPLVQCPKCELGGEFGCDCCGGEGLLPMFEAEDWIEREAANVDAMMAEDEDVMALVDWMIETHPDGLRT